MASRGTKQWGEEGTTLQSSCGGVISNEAPLSGRYNGLSPWRGRTPERPSLSGQTPGSRVIITHYVAMAPCGNGPPVRL